MTEKLPYIQICGSKVRTSYKNGVKVISIDRTAGLLGKSIQVKWITESTPKSCWVKPNTIELIDIIPTEKPKIGDHVKIRKNVIQD